MTLPHDTEKARHQQEHPEAHQLEVFNLDEQLGQHEQLLVAHRRHSVQQAVLHTLQLHQDLIQTR